MLTELAWSPLDYRDHGDPREAVAHSGSSGRVRIDTAPDSRSIECSHLLTPIGLREGFATGSELRERTVRRWWILSPESCESDRAGDRTLLRGIRWSNA
jgi:hypothetical protein